MPAMRLGRLFAGPVCLLLAFPLLATAAGSMAVGAPNPLEAFLEGLETYAADFEQRLTDESGAELEISRGRLRLRRPAMFFWSYREPYAQTIVSDGATLWIHDEDLDQLIIKDAPDSVADAPALLFSGDADLAEHYEMVERQGDSGLRWLALTPKDPEAQYSGLRLAFSEGALRGMTLSDSLGQTTLILLHETERNPPLAPELFRLSPPEGVDLIDLRGETAGARQAGSGPGAKQRGAGAQGAGPGAEQRGAGAQGAGPGAEQQDAGAQSAGPGAEQQDAGAGAEQRGAGPGAEQRGAGSQGAGPGAEQQDAGAQGVGPP